MPLPGEKREGGIGSFDWQSADRRASLPARDNDASEFEFRWSIGAGGTMTYRDVGWRTGSEALADAPRVGDAFGVAEDR